MWLAGRFFDDCSVASNPISISSCQNGYRNTADPMVPTIRPGKIHGKRYAQTKVEMMVGKFEIPEFGDFGALAHSQEHFRIQNRRCSCAAHNVLNPNGL